MKFRVVLLAVLYACYPAG